MSDDYCCGSSRRSKNDKRRKRRDRVYKRGGFGRTQEIDYTQNREQKTN